MGLVNQVATTKFSLNDAMSWGESSGVSQYLVPIRKFVLTSGKYKHPKRGDKKEGQCRSQR